MKYLKNCTILYVEDDLNIVNLIKEILISRVKELYIANDGIEGLNMYKNKKPDIILSDIVMPNMDGIEMSKEIKKIDKHQQIALLTGYDDREHFIEAINAGVSRYILKPISEVKTLFVQLEELAYITHIKKVEQQEQYIKEQEKRLNSISSILLNISHQYRQPLSIVSTVLTGIKLNIDFKNEIDIEKLKIDINKADLNIKYLSEIIEQSINFFDTFNNKKEELNLVDIIENLEIYFENEFREHNIVIKKDINTKKCIKCDKMLLSMVLQNIVRNAIEVLSKKDKNDRYIEFSTKCTQNDFCLSITDSGGGIPNNIIDDIFDPYFTTKHKYIGVGLSLYIANQIVKFHLQGELSVYNSELFIDDKKFKGAKFILTSKIDNGE